MCEKSAAGEYTCHPERSEGPMHSLAARKLHGFFATVRMTNRLEAIKNPC
jgi:hypothetical protein